VLSKTLHPAPGVIEELERLPGMKPFHFRRTAGILILLALCCVLVFLYIPLLRNWFRADDTYVMWASASLKLPEMFFSPERHRLLSSNFNPMYGVSLKTDWLLFGMNPVGYAVHCLISLVATAIVLYFFIRLYAEKKQALFGVMLFLFNPITFQMAGLFFRRHYMEGLFCSLLSLYLFVKADREGRMSLPAAIFYLLASLYREVYVVLPAIAFLISRQGPISKRIRNTVPLWAGLLIYTAWRLWIRGGLGGYPSNEPFFSLTNLQFIPKIFVYLSLQLSQEHPVLMYLLLSILIASSLRHARLLLCFLILTIPILPVSNIITANHLEMKYFFHITVFIIICISLLINNPPIRNALLFRGVVVSLCLLLTLIFIRTDFRTRDTMLNESVSAKKTAMEFMYSDKNYIRAEQPSWFYEGLRRISRDFRGKEIKTRLVPPANLLKYSALGKLKEIEASGIDVPFDEIDNAQKDFKKGPIFIKITMDNYKLSWDFGPYKNKKYTMLRSLVSGLYYNSSELRSSGTYMLAKGNLNDHPETTYFRILYHSESGKEVVSPEFEFKVPSMSTIVYKKD
jgi:hypothetical protein